MREPDDMMEAIEYHENVAPLSPHVFNFTTYGIGTGKSIWTEEKIEELKTAIRKAKEEGKLQ